MSSIAQTARRSLMVIPAALGFMVLYIWDDFIFAAPIAVVAALYGIWVSFTLFAVLYTLASIAIGMLAVKGYERRTQGEPSKLAARLEKEIRKDRSKLGKRLLTSVGAVGFVLASFFVGGIVTTFMIRYMGRREGILKVSILSSIIFGVTFVGFYSGLTGLFL